MCTQHPKAGQNTQQLLSKYCLPLIKNDGRVNGTLPKHEEGDQLKTSCQWLPSNTPMT